MEAEAETKILADPEAEMEVVQKEMGAKMEVGIREDRGLALEEMEVERLGQVEMEIRGLEQAGVEGQAKN